MRPCQGSGLRAERPKRRGEGDPPLFQNECSDFSDDRRVQMPLAFPRSEIKFEVRRPECARFYQANWPRQARDGAGPRSARTDSPMPAALSFFRCTALRAPRSALGAFIFSARGAPACSLLSERILSEMKQQQQQQQQQQAREALQEHLHNKHAREEERQPPCKKSCSISSSSSSSSK